MFAYSKTIWALPLANIVPITVVGAVELGIKTVESTIYENDVDEALVRELDEEFKKLMMN